MTAKHLFMAAIVGAALMTACSPSQKETVEEQPQDNPEMGIIDNGDSLVVTDVAPSDSLQIAADTAAVTK